jgi:hypothetical protein
MVMIQFTRFCLIFIFALLLVRYVMIPTDIIAQPRQDGLYNATDVLNNVLFGWRATHSIAFTLPSDSFQIRNTDYIIIHLPEFSDITPVTLVTGEYSGIPVFSVDGKNAQITGITVLPGARITIEGITAINPDADDKFQVIIMVTEDSEATKLKNYANILATLNYANVSVSATIPVELANLRISGWTGPDTFLIFSEANAVLGTDVANGVGGFNRLFTGLQPATHRISFYGIDRNNLTTSTYPIQIYTAGFQETLISNILLSPTIQINGDSFLPGNPIIASGSAYPETLITLFVDAPMRSYYASASATGEWTYTINNSNEFVYGDYRIYALAQTTAGLQSLMSNTIQFTMRPTLIPVGEACGNIAQGDLNCDGQIDLTDFSILMYYWGTANASADINSDGIVNLTDFSILMYWWGT